MIWALVVSSLFASAYTGHRHEVRMDEYATQEACEAAAVANREHYRPYNVPEIDLRWECRRERGPMTSLVFLCLALLSMGIAIATFPHRSTPRPTIDLLGLGIGAALDLADTQEPDHVVYRFVADRDKDGAWILRKTAHPSGR